MGQRKSDVDHKMVEATPLKETDDGISEMASSEESSSEEEKEAAQNGKDDEQSASDDDEGYVNQYTCIYPSERNPESEY